MSALDDIRQRAADVARWREHFMPPLSKIYFSQRDVPRLLAALDAVLATHAACYGGRGCETTRAVNDALEVAE